MHCDYFLYTTLIHILDQSLHHIYHRHKHVHRHICWFKKRLSIPLKSQFVPFLSSWFSQHEQEVKGSFLLEGEFVHRLIVYSSFGGWKILAISLMDIMFSCARSSPCSMCSPSHIFAFFFLPLRNIVRIITFISVMCHFFLIEILRAVWRFSDLRLQRGPAGQSLV